MLIETRDKQHNVEKMLKNIALGWDHLDNYHTAINERIWII